MIDQGLKRKLSPLLRGEGTPFATTLLAGLIRSYGVEMLEWDPTTLYLEIKDDFDVDMPRKNFDRLMGLLNAITTQTVYTEVEAFDETVSALAGYGVNTQQDIPTVLDVAWAVTEIRLADPAPVGREDNPWSPNIGRYIRVVLDDEGMAVPPQCLDFVPMGKLPDSLEPTAYNDAFGSLKARADEIDQKINSIAVMMIGQLQYLGLAPEATAL